MATRAHPQQPLTDPPPSGPAPGRSERVIAAAITSSSHTAFVVGLGVALGAGVSMGWSEAGSDTGEETGRGSAVVRGSITGGMTVLGSIFHTLPFLISDVNKALIVAGVVV